MKERAPLNVPGVKNKFDWQPDFIDRYEFSDALARHPGHDAGHYYLMDFSSAAVASLLTELSVGIQTVLDLCASPGGKAIFASRLLHPQTLVCNEVIGSRVGLLIGNLKRCGIPNAIVTKSDPSYFANEHAGSADLVLVDAPCSGQSLLAKGKKADGCFHPVTIKRNALRQRRILGCAQATVRGQGYLLYSTCSYSREENEENIRWFVRKFPTFKPVVVQKFVAFQSPYSDLPCYRLWPDEDVGAGGFAAIFKNTDDEDIGPRQITQIRSVWQSDDFKGRLV